MIQAGIIGASGYTGQELVRLLSSHPDTEVSIVTSRTYDGQELSSIYGNLRSFQDTACRDISMEEAAETCDVLFLALPHGIASKQVKKSILDTCRIIDLGADFRLKNADAYEAWYHTAHGNRDLLKHAVYGLCEWHRKEIADTKLTANPGCYTTASILALAPLLKEKVISPDSIIIDAKSGVTGAGRSAKTAMLYAECNESIKAYGISSHRHTPEIEEQLSSLSGRETQLTFTPHLVPMNRGILVTAYARPEMGVTSSQIRDVFEGYYGKEPFIRLLPSGSFPETRWVKGSNLCDINSALDERTGTVIIGSAIDNLVKGASGQAVQNMNIMFGLPETMGLTTVPGFPM